MREIKVWGGTHANELLSIAVAESLIAEPTPGVDAGLVNLCALDLGRRYVDINMNDGYPGNKDSSRYEERRAVAVLEASQKYDTVIDFHDANTCYSETTAYIGSRGVQPHILGFLATLGMERLVLSSHNALREHLDNSFLTDVDLSKGGVETSVNYWRDSFSYLAQTPVLPEAVPDDFEWYEWTADITVEQTHPSGLNGSAAPFGRLPASMERQLGFDRPQHIFSWTPDATEGCWAELCTPIAPPDPSSWPGFSE